MAIGIDLIVGGNTYNLNDGTNYKVVADDGLGMPDIHHLEQLGAQQHGATSKGFLLQPRVFWLLVAAIETTEAGHFGSRESLMQYLVPQDTAISMLYTETDGTARQIDCYYHGGMSLPSKRRHRYHYKTAIKLWAPDPIFYDPTQVTVTATLAAASNLVFPITFPITFSSNLIQHQEDIAYTGSWDEYPVIEITGPIEDPKVRNATQAEEVELDYTVASGEVVTIDCRYGAKTVENAFGNNLIRYMTDDSDLTNLRILAAVDGTASRTNSFELSGSSATIGTTKMVIKYYKRYLGI